MEEQHKVMGIHMQKLSALGILFGLTALVGACTPKVEVAVPDKPITINLNVKIEHEVRVKVEKDLEQVFSDDSGLF